MALLIAIPILSGLLILQTAIVSNIPLLNGSADLVLVAVVAWALQKRVRTAWGWGIIGGLSVSFVSGLPFLLPLIGCLAAVGLALLLRQRMWRVPILAMFLTMFVGTLLVHAITVIYLRITGVNIPLFQALNVVTLPSIILNLLVAIPMYAIMGELANWLYPEEIEV